MQKAPTGQKYQGYLLLLIPKQIKYTYKYANEHLTEEFSRAYNCKLTYHSLKL